MLSKNKILPVDGNKNEMAEQNEAGAQYQTCTKLTPSPRYPTVSMLHVDKTARGFSVSLLFPSLSHLGAPQH